MMYASYYCQYTVSVNLKQLCGHVAFHSCHYCMMANMHSVCGMAVISDMDTSFPVNSMCGQQSYCPFRTI